MTGCNMLDFGKPARQNGKRLPCERLMDENAKLRELVDGLRYCANESHGHGRCNVRFIDGYVTCCPLYDVDSNTARCEALLQELGIEVG